MKYQFVTLRFIVTWAFALSAVACSGTQTAPLVPKSHSAVPQPQCAIAGCRPPTSETLYVLYNEENAAFFPDVLDLYDVATGAQIPFTNFYTIGTSQMAVTSDRRFIVRGSSPSDGAVFDVVTNTVTSIDGSRPFGLSGDQQHIYFVGLGNAESTTIPPSTYTSYDLQTGELQAFTTDMNGSNIFVLDGRSPNTELKFFNTAANQFTATLRLPGVGIPFPSSNPIIYDALSNQLYILGFSEATEHAELIVVDATTHRLSCANIDLGSDHFRATTLAMNRSGSLLFVVRSTTVTRYAIAPNGSAVTLGQFSLQGTASPPVAVNDAGTHLFVHIASVASPEPSIQELDATTGQVIRSFPDRSVVDPEHDFQRTLKAIVVR